MVTNTDSNCVSPQATKRRSAPFDARYCSRSTEVYVLTQHLSAEIEISSGLYRRRLSGPSRLKLIEAVECLVVNFMRLHFTDPGRELAVPLGKDSEGYEHFSDRYRTTKAIKGLEMLGYVSLVEKGYRGKRKKGGKVTRYVETPLLLERFALFDVGPTMVQIRERQPLVELRLSKKAHRALEKRKGRKCSKRLAWPNEYRGNKSGMTSDLRKINAAFSEQFIGLHVKDASLRKALGKQKRPVNMFQKDLHRVFTTDPTKGGRFAGAWWFTLPSTLRPHVRMSAPGKPPAPTVELDYEALHFRMLYAEEGVPCTEDPYSIYNDPAKNKATRKAVKSLSFNMINADNREDALNAMKKRINKKLFPDWWGKAHPGESWPTLTSGSKENEKVALMWPGCPTLQALMQDIEAKHMPIAKHFGSGAGRRLMFKDSQIAERILLRMIDEHGVAPLPVHDSYIVRYDYKDALWEIMQDEFADAMGVTIPITKRLRCRKKTMPMRCQNRGTCWPLILPKKSNKNGPKNSRLFASISRC
jgi:hypothetical protein